MLNQDTTLYFYMFNDINNNIKLISIYTPLKI